MQVRGTQWQTFQPVFAHWHAAWGARQGGFAACDSPPSFARPFSPSPASFQSICAETHNAETHNSVNMVTECPGRRGSGWTVGRRPSNVTAAAVDHPMNSGRDPAWKSCGGLETRVGAVQALQ